MSKYTPDPLAPPLHSPKSSAGSSGRGLNHPKMYLGTFTASFQTLLVGFCVVLHPSFPKSFPYTFAGYSTALLPTGFVSTAEKNLPAAALVRALSWKSAGNQLEGLIPSHPSVLTSLKFRDGLDRDAGASFCPLLQPLLAGT